MPEEANNPIETSGSESIAADGCEPTGHTTEPIECEDCAHCQTINDDMTTYCHKHGREVYATCDDFEFC